LSVFSNSTMPTTPRRAAASAAARNASVVGGEAAASFGPTANQSHSRTIPDSSGCAPSRAAAAEFIHAQCRSPLIRTTGVEPATSSRARSVGGDDHVPSRKP
jgi:hypothetical protein